MVRVDLAALHPDPPCGAVGNADEAAREDHRVRVRELVAAVLAASDRDDCGHAMEAAGELLELLRRRLC